MRERDDYERISQAIRYLREELTQQPSLKIVAEHLGLSPFHFQRLFSRWAGVSPKKYLQVLTVERGKELLSRGLSVLGRVDIHQVPQTTAAATSTKAA